MQIRNQVQLVTYPDGLGGTLAALNHNLEQHFPDLFGGIHILPPYPSTGHRGFAPITYFEIEPAFGDWQDVQRLRARYDVLVDVMVNHISRHSTYFSDFIQNGRDSEYADMFITLDKVWRDGVIDPAQFAKIFLRRPDHCFETVTIQKTGEAETVWATFGKKDWSEQIDLDVNSDITRGFFRKVLAFMQEQRVNVLRLDAIAFVTKKAGTSCFFVEPEIYDFLNWFRDEAERCDIEVLPEVHAEPAIQSQLAAHGFPVYNFVLPFLILHTLLSCSSSALQAHLQSCPKRQITMLDCHDGIPVQPDINGVVAIAEARAVVDHCLRQGANISRIFNAQHILQDGFDAHQINCTYYSALEANDDAYMLARAIQFFAPGIPQVYYVGLLAGENDYAAVEETGEKRAINRHNFTDAEIQTALQKSVVQRLTKLIDFRSHHPAFQGELTVHATTSERLELSRHFAGHDVTLRVDLEQIRCEIEVGEADGSRYTFKP